MQDDLEILLEDALDCITLPASQKRVLVHDEVHIDTKECFATKAASSGIAGQSCIGEAIASVIDG